MSDIPNKNKTHSKRIRLPVWWHDWWRKPLGQKAIDILFKGPLALVLGIGATVLVILGLAGAVGLAAGIVMGMPIWGIVAIAVAAVIILNVVGVLAYKAYKRHHVYVDDIDVKPTPGAEEAKPDNTREAATQQLSPTETETMTSTSTNSSPTTITPTSANDAAQDVSDDDVLAYSTDDSSDNDSASTHALSDSDDDDDDKTTHRRSLTANAAVLASYANPLTVQAKFNDVKQRPRSYSADYEHPSSSKISQQLEDNIKTCLQNTQSQALPTDPQSSSAEGNSAASVDDDILTINSILSKRTSLGAETNCSDTPSLAAGEEGSRWHVKTRNDENTDTLGNLPLSSPDTVPTFTHPSRATSQARPRSLFIQSTKQFKKPVNRPPRSASVRPRRKSDKSFISQLTNTEEAAIEHFISAEGGEQALTQLLDARTQARMRRSSFFQTTQFTCDTSSMLAQTARQSTTSSQDSDENKTGESPGYNR